MDTFENTPAGQPNPDPAAQSDLADIRAACEALRHSLVSVLILVLVVSGTLNLFFLRQYRNDKSQLKIEGPQIGQIVAEYNRNEGPVLSELVKRLNDFGKTHPDIEPLLARYGIKPASPTGAATPSATSAPPSAQKK